MRQGDLSLELSIQMTQSLSISCFIPIDYRGARIHNTSIYLFLFAANFLMILLSVPALDGTDTSVAHFIREIIELPFIRLNLI